MRAPAEHVCRRCVDGNPWPLGTTGHDLQAARLELHRVFWTLADPVCRPIVRGLTDLINRLTRKAHQ